VVLRHLGFATSISQSHCSHRRRFAQCGDCSLLIVLDVVQDGSFGLDLVV
jgi:hypothetical protein